MNLEKQIEAYNKTALKYTEENLSFTIPGVHFSPEEVLHISSIVTSILMTRDGVGYPGGEMIKAILEDDLQNPALEDDTLCKKALKFLIQAKQWCAVSY
jgi:hypothetical protein